MSDKIVGFYVPSFKQRSEVLDKYIKILQLNDVEYCLLDPNCDCFWKHTQTCEYVILHHPHYRSQLEQASTFLPIFENYLSIKCFPDIKTSWHYDDKIKQFYLLSQAGFNYIPSHIYYNETDALVYSEAAEYPLVFKLRGGAGSSNVRLIKCEREAKAFIKTMFSVGMVNSQLSLGWSKDLRAYDFPTVALNKIKKTYHKIINGYHRSNFWGTERDYVLFQDYLGGNEFDTRVTVIGNRAFAFRRFNRANDFRASGSGNIDWNEKQIDLRCVKMAFEISDHFSFQSMAYDFVYDKHNNPAICEISYTFQDKAVYRCSGYWDSDLNWILGHYWPEWCILSDLLDNPNLVQVS